MASRKQLSNLEKTIGSGTPYCTGTLSVPSRTFVLYYGKDETLGRIDLSSATTSELEKLAASCTKATFGVNQEDVLDESYRKAGKLDASELGFDFDIQASGIIDLIRTELLEGHNLRKGVRAELYKLNVYDKGSFFKAHKDTPRGAKMFGSLVLVFPTPYEGGALTLRHKGEEHILDHAKTFSEQPKPVLAYTAFFSDVEHEVALVTSGHRITITYNLYFDAVPALPPVAERPVQKVKFSTELKALLADDTFFPEGGLMAFGLKHEYPIENHSLYGLLECLKGTDAIIARVLRESSLKPELRMFYECDNNRYSPWGVMTTESLTDIEGDYEQDTIARIVDDHGGEQYRNPGEKGPDGEVPEDVTEVYWVRQPTYTSSLKATFVAYGNEPSIDSIYGSPSLVVQVGPYGSR